MLEVNREFFKKELEKYWNKHKLSFKAYTVGTANSIAAFCKAGFIRDQELNPTKKRIPDTDYNRHKLAISSLKKLIESATEFNDNESVLALVAKCKSLFQSNTKDGLLPILDAIETAVHFEESKMYQPVYPIAMP